jgi:hypothetical protein
MAGLAEMTLQFAADGSVLDRFEVAGDPDGGFEANFALGGLSLGLSTRLQLVDAFDNLPLPAEQTEALLVGFLAFSGDATLDLNGLDLLISQQSPDTVETWISQGRIVNTAADRITISYDSARNCTVVDAAVPEPATMSLLGLGGLAALLRRCRNYHCPPS